MRLFVTGFTSSFVKVMLSQLKDLEILKLNQQQTGILKRCFLIFQQLIILKPVIIYCTLVRTWKKDPY